MDTSTDTQHIIGTTIALVNSTQDEAQLTTVLTLTNNLLFVLDDDKSVEYKIAIIEEYLEGIAGIITTPGPAELLIHLRQLKTPAEQKIACEGVCFAITQYFDPAVVDPHLVSFWLQRASDIQTLKLMDTLMLFLTKEQQAKVLKRDKSLLTEAKVQKIIECLLAA